MSRLQVGCLALIIGYETSTRNLYKTVTLDEYLGRVEFDDGSIWGDCWVVSSENLVDAAYCNTEWVYARALFLMPLGDKQTQDELAKEKEHEFN